MMEAGEKDEYVRESTVTGSVLTPAFGPTSHTHSFCCDSLGPDLMTTDIAVSLLLLNMTCFSITRFYSPVTLACLESAYSTRCWLFGLFALSTL